MNESRELWLVFLAFPRSAAALSEPVYSTHITYPFGLDLFVRVRNGRLAAPHRQLSFLASA